MKTGIANKMTRIADNRIMFPANDSDYKVVHQAMISTLNSKSMDYSEASDDIKKQFEIIVRAYGNICDILAEKNYIKRDYKGICQVEPLSGEDTDYDYMDVLETADSIFTAARDIKDNFEDHVRLNIASKREYFEKVSILTGICLLMKELVTEVSSYPTWQYGNQNK